MTIGERIKNIRENTLRISQVSMAEKIRVSKQTLYKYENNIITNIPSDKIEAIARLADISPAEIMGWEYPAEIRIPDYVALTQDETDLLSDYRKLNAVGREKALDSVHDLTEIKKYIAPDSDNRLVETA